MQTSEFCMAVCGASSFADREVIMCVQQLAILLQHDTIMSNLLVDVIFKTYLILFV
jgi:hypothetical protein